MKIEKIDIEENEIPTIQTIKINEIIEHINKEKRNEKNG